MIDPIELFFCLMIPGLFVWGFSVIVRNRISTSSLDLAAALGIAVALVVLRWLTEFNSLSQGDEWTVSLTRLQQRFFFPKEARDWLVYLVPLAGIFSLLENRFLKRRWFALLWGFFFAAELWLILQGSVYLNSEWSRVDMLKWFGGLGLFVAAAAVISGLGPIPVSLRNRLKRCLMIFVFVTATVVSLTSGSLTLAMTCLCSAAACGHAALASLTNKSDKTCSLSGGFWVFVLASNLSLGLFFAEVTLVDWGLLVAASGVVGVAGIATVGKRGTIFFIAMACLLTLGLSGAAGQRSVSKFLDQMKQEKLDPYKSAYGK